MRTLLDQMIKDLLLTLLGVGLASSIDDVLQACFGIHDKILSVLRVFIALLCFGQCFITVLTKYLLIFHSSTIFEHVSDDIYILMTRLTNLLIGVLLTSYSLVTVGESEASIGAQNASSEGIFGMILLDIFSVLFLQLRIEMAKLKKALPGQIGYSNGTRWSIIGLATAGVVFTFLRVIPTQSTEASKLKYHVCVTVIVQNIIPAVTIMKNENIQKYLSRKVSTQPV